MCKKSSMMKKLLLFLFLTSWFIIPLSAQTTSLEDLLFNLPDVKFKKIESPNSTELTYELNVKQPIDHSDIQKGFFYQKVYLSHKGFDKPTVIVTQGYQVAQNREQELTELLNANQLNIEHRFFGESLPDSLNYNYLNLKQATADIHHIRQLFDQIYSQKWISTGISKGGSTTIFYRYYYPDDVDVSVSYVAPLTNTFEDKRIYNFLDTIGSNECRQKIKQFQTRLLENRERVIPLLHFYSLGAGWDFTYLTIERAFELAVLEYPFAFWQWGHSCSEIPSEESTLEESVEYFMKIDPLSLFNDALIEKYGSHYYQAATEMGYYGYEIKDFKKYLVSIPTNTNPHATFLPEKMPAEFDGELLKKVHEWLQSDGDEFIYIYGVNDTWTSCAVPESNEVDAEWFFMEGKHHGNARIRNMNDANKERLISALENWLSLKIDNTLTESK